MMIAKWCISGIIVLLVLLNGSYTRADIGFTLLPSRTAAVGASVVFRSVVTDHENGTVIWIANGKTVVSMTFVDSSWNVEVSYRVLYRHRLQNVHAFTVGYQLSQA